jgi:hypothetical protein
VLDERSRCRTAGQANRQFLAEAERPVVPPFARVGEGKAGQICVLLFEQRADEVNVDRRFRGRRLHVRHSSSVHFRGGA